MTVKRWIVINNCKNIIRQLSVIAADVNNPQKSEWQYLLDLARQMLSEAKSGQFESAKKNWIELQQKVTALNASGTITQELETSAVQLKEAGLL